MNSEQESALLRDWYTATARGFLAEVAPERLPALDPLFERLALREEHELPICFLGNAGVGKSTLINALVAGSHSLVPAGGVGPLTAQATLIRYAPSPADRRFRATYLPARRLNNVLFALERWHERSIGRSTPPDLAGSVEPLSEDETEITEALIAPEESTEPGAPSDKVEGFLRQACLMIHGGQYREHYDVPYLLDALRECLSLPPRWATERTAEDAVRVAAIARALTAREQTHAVGEQTGLQEFLIALQDHASGFLAPIIKNLEVWWDADVLRSGLVFVDLPGVGVANDEYRRVTAEWIRKARAVVLVVNSRGITDASAELLRSTGFLTSLLHESPDPDSEPPILVVAAVQLDIVAHSDWSGDRERYGREKAQPWGHYFRAVCEGMQKLIRGQAKNEFEKLFEGGSDATRMVRAEVLEQVLATLQVHTVSASEYRKLLLADDEERARIKEADESLVPALAGALEALGRAREERLLVRAEARISDARDRTRTALDIVLAQWREGARAEEDATRLRSELDVLAKPLRAELATRQGEFREFLRSTMLERIRFETLAAAEEAENEIEKYLKKFESYHWSTLRAAVRRGGTFVGAKHVDIPNELTLRFEEPIAIVWSRKLLVDLRRRTRALAEDHVQLVGQVLIWAKGQGARVRPELVEALHEDLKAQSKELTEVGKDAIDDLRTRVKQELFAKVEDEVRKRCSKFVTSRQDQGAGTKLRIVGFLRDELRRSVMNAAVPAAIGVLEANYMRVNAEIKVAFDRVPNPVETAIDAIASAHEDALRRSDAQKRRRVLDRGGDVLDALPGARSGTSSAVAVS